MARAVINALLAIEHQKGQAKGHVRSPGPRKSASIKTQHGARRLPLRIIGVGGAGLNILSRISESELEFAEVLGADTKALHLALSGVPRKILMVGDPEMLYGSDTNPASGREAALGAKEELQEALDGARYVIVLCGLGGATGTGAAPVITRIAHDAGLMTAAICLWPFSGEGRNIESNAEFGVRELMKSVDIVVLVPNDALIEADPELSLDMAFDAVDKIVVQTIKTIFEKFSSLDARASPQTIGCRSSNIDRAQ